MEGQLMLDDNDVVGDELEILVKRALDRYKTFEPKEGYYLAFSGGKDSIVIKALADMAGVKYDAHYAITTVDPPELLRFVKQYHPDVERIIPKETMWQLIPRKLMPPTRMVRYCCKELKEEGGSGRFVVTGVRWDESVRRKNNRKEIEFDTYGSNAKDALELKKVFYLLNDNDGKRKMIETCAIKGKHILNPIIEWTDEHIWLFIKKYNIPYCKLYDEGFKRLGCLGCPNSGQKGMIRDFKRYPTVYKKYLKAFDEMLKIRNEKGLVTNRWKDGKDVMCWWLDLSKKDFESVHNDILKGIEVKK
jgi:phosphoadenosine phosphosulfate reductase